MRLKFFIRAIVVVVLLGNISLGLFLLNKKTEKSSVVITPTPTLASQGVPLQGKSDYFSYQGVEGKDALTLFKEKAEVEQDSSGLVVSINGRKAQTSKREYWAFYVNGSLAPVGPADYKTKEGDAIEWKIETY